MHVLYRISSNSYKKERLSFATKEYCLSNFIENVLTTSDKMTIIADCVDDDLRQTVNNYKNSNIDIVHEKLGSNGASFRFQVDFATSLPDEEIVLLQEDDYIYKPAHWPYQSCTTYHELTSEALSFAHYVSFYDHPDKYLSPKFGGNKFITDHGVENTGIFRTRNSHWKYTNSTTCTFATTAKVIKQDQKIWRLFCSGDHPHDFQSFLALGSHGRTLATSLPGKATHTEKPWISPFFDHNLS